MPDTRPGIQFDSSGVCYPCLSAERAQKTDWNKRREEFAVLCGRHRVKHASDAYDCVVPVSGGKDSHVQVAALKAEGMRPLLVSVGDWFAHTRAGEANFRNMCQEFACDSFIWRQSPSEMRDMVRRAFFAFGSPTWPIDAAIYAVPLRVARMAGVELVVYGEDIAYTYGGPGATETPSARRQHRNDVVKDAGWRMVEHRSWLQMPDDRDLDALEPIYMSYYTHWDGRQNYERAKLMGFRDCAREWPREGCIEDYDQIDSKGYMVHPWLKYPKFGHARATDVACNWVRNGYITRDEAVDLVMEHDHKLDPEALDDFLSFTGIARAEFWGRVDQLYNRDLFERRNGLWALRQPPRKGLSVAHLYAAQGERERDNRDKERGRPWQSTLTR
jgi:N-acetyl sugar amidotransferase